ncbi:MAG: hypothetical protein IJ190_12760 [Prevotella sp.]|nr:hypothetical protein [Prevotella sp.]
MKKILFLFAMMLTVVTASANVKYATFVAPTGTGGSYNAETRTYTWTKNSDNLMNVFTFENGELANYKSLHVVRVGGTYSNPWRANVLFSDGKNKSFSWYNYNDKNIDLSAGDWAGQNLTVDDVTHTLADVTAIRIGGASDDGAVVLDWSCVYLENDDDAVEIATFSKIANQATYIPDTYTWDATYSNLIDIYTGTAGDFSKFGVLQFTFSGKTAGAVRIGYSTDGSNFNTFNEGNYYTDGTKQVDLSGFDLSAAVKIQFGGTAAAGSCTIRPDQIYLVRSDVYNRQFTAEQTATVWLPFELTAAEAAEAGTFYELNAATSTTLTFKEVSTPEAYKPYIFVAKESGTPFSEMKSKTIVAPTTCSYTVGDYTFVGTMGDIKAPAGAYGFNNENGNFSQVTEANAVSIAPFRAYIIATGGAAARDLDIVIDGLSTGISEAKKAQSTDSAIYNLNGQRVSADYKGVVIKNGKKVVMK